METKHTKPKYIGPVDPVKIHRENHHQTLEIKSKPFIWGNYRQKRLNDYGIPIL